LLRAISARVRRWHTREACITFIQPPPDNQNRLAAGIQGAVEQEVDVLTVPCRRGQLRDAAEWNQRTFAGSLKAPGIVVAVIPYLVLS
jgi:hypothetical protein